MTSPSPKPRKRAPAAPPTESGAAPDAAAVETAADAPIAALAWPGPDASPATGPVVVNQGAVGRAEATSLEVHQGAVGAARADTITIDQGALGLTAAGEVNVRQGVVGSILAGSARVEQSFVRTLVAGEVRIERATGVGILFARKVVGDVKVILDWRGALAFGAAAGVVAGLLRRGRKRDDAAPRERDA
jgi:hypothetical protein